MAVIIVPGIDDSGDEHWQSLWQRELAGCVRIEPSSWARPEVDDWVRAIDRAVGAQPAGTSTLVAHSLGALAVAEWFRRGTGSAASALLVAPPDPEGPMFPVDAAGSFQGLTIDSFGVPTVLVASDDDPFGSVAFATGFARTAGARLVVLAGVGHINVASGIGAWPQGRALLEQLRAAADLRA